jgi:hypothetical protein
MQEMKKFDPTQFLIRVNGAEYLEVKWRLAWLRAEHPEARIETELVQMSPERAIFRAQVALPEGGSSTGWGSETPDDFGDYLEKAETKALGRALAALGFGTQFCFDFDGDGMDNVVDAPVRLPTYKRQARRLPEPGEQASVAAINQSVTDRQKNFIQAIAREKGLSDDEVSDEIRERFGVAELDKLDRRQASSLIEILRERRDVPMAS